MNMLADTHYFLAIDLGAGSGRALLGELSGEKLSTREILRFKNEYLEIHGKRYWDIFGIYKHIGQALGQCAREKIPLSSLGVNSWGVDFVYLGADQSVLGLPRCYRDRYTEHIPELFYRHTDAFAVYQKTGIQTLPFNSLFQLQAARGELFSPMQQASHILFIPDFLNFLLTGKKSWEYSITSTSQMLNIHQGDFDAGLMLEAGLDPSWVGRPIAPGTVLGGLAEPLASETGYHGLKVVAVAGHDTASAVAAVPAEKPGFAYLSSGTWSLMGIETDKPILSRDAFDANFTNELGIENTIRFLKNITGLWILEQCVRAWEKEGLCYTHDMLADMARRARPFSLLIDPDHPLFVAPANMLSAIHSYCHLSGQPLPENDAQLVRGILDSLALKYGQTMRQLQALSPVKLQKLHIIGGGARNGLLCQLTANATGMPVLAGPSEASSIGNMLVQAMAHGLIADRWHLSRAVAGSFPLSTYTPREDESWKLAAYQYMRLLKRNTNMIPLL